METTEPCPDKAPDDSDGATDHVAEQHAADNTASVEREEDLEADAQAGEAPASEEEQPEDPVATIDALKLALETAEAEALSLKDQALRAAAETENVRKRADRSVANAHKFALERFAGDLLPVIDSFERALEAATSLASEHEPAASTVEGIELSLRLMNETLGRHGVEAIDPVGEPLQPFLPRSHEHGAEPRRGAGLGAASGAEGLHAERSPGAPGASAGCQGA